MKKLIKKIFILIIVLVIIDYSIGLILNQILINSPDGRYHKAYHSLLKCNDEIIIFGSSRAETNFASYVFEDSLGYSCWNTGRGGQMLPFWYAIQMGILERYIPKIVIINVENDFLTEDFDKGAYERIGFLRPFYYLQPVIQPIINKISKYERYKMGSKIYSYNSSFYYLLRPYLLKGLDGKIEERGWKPRDGKIKDKTGKMYIENSKKNLNHDSVLLFEKFIGNFISKGCEVYVVISPNHGILIESTSTIKYLNSKKELVLLNYANNHSFSENSDIFMDSSHLNRLGAVKFSKRICSRILTLD